MRSYYAHLETIAPKTGPLITKPVFRSSAIFPVMHTPMISSRILFMGYWILKRNIKEIAALVTLRDIKGIVLARLPFSITEAKTFRIEVAELLKIGNIPLENDFFGSMEIEFFSTQNLVFPFPAVVINYYGPKFSTVVHTAQRIYNDYEDMIKNSQTDVPESGFNIYADEEKEPFIGIVNGTLPINDVPMHLEIFNHKQETLKCLIDLGSVDPHETKWIYPARFCKLKDFLEGRPGTCKAHFHVTGIFPRLLVGNLHTNIPAVTITHSYYDCSKASSNSDYWHASNPNYYPSALMIPACIANNHFTNVYFYPIYSPSDFVIDIEIFDPKGIKIASKKDALKISSSNPQFHQITLQTLFRSIDIPTDIDYGVRLIARPFNDGDFPARIKLGLDIGIQGFQTPCNICTNLQPFNPSLEDKPSSFRWAPILADHDSATVWIMNSSPEINYQKSAVLDITFFREADTSTIKRQLTLTPNGFIIIKVHEEAELREFFNNEIGWLTITTTNPYTSVYYFVENKSGVVGGDHGF